MWIKKFNGPAFWKNRQKTQQDSYNNMIFIYIFICSKIGQNEKELDFKP